MDKIQLIFFFISGFLVSRLIIKVKLPQRIVYWFIGKKHLSITKILFYLIAISAFLSFFIPNAITVLTLLPLIELLRRSYEESNGSSRRIATMLALAIIYGANIGGMGSVTATPANGILVTYAVLENVPGTRDISFASWLVWGIPLGSYIRLCCLVGLDIDAASLEIKSRRYAASLSVHGCLSSVSKNCSLDYDILLHIVIYIVTDANALLRRKPIPFWSSPQSSRCFLFYSYFFYR